MHTPRPTGRRDAPASPAGIRHAVEAVTAYRCARAQAVDRAVDRALMAATVAACAWLLAGCGSTPAAAARVQDHTPALGQQLRSDITECWTMAWHEAHRRAAEDAATTGRPVDTQAVQAAAVPMARACLLLRGVDLPPVEGR